MKWGKADLVKFKDVGKNNLALFIAILVLVPLLLLCHYLINPKHYISNLKIQLGSSPEFPAESKDPQKELLDAMKNTKFFTPEEVQYLEKNFRFEEIDKSTFQIILSDEKEKSLASYSRKVAEVLQNRLGSLTYSEYLDEKARLEALITNIENEKTSLEEYFQILDEDKLQKEKNLLSDQIAQLDNQISSKIKQLTIIQSKLISPKDNNTSIFKSKVDSILADLNSLKEEKQGLEEKYSFVLKSLEGMKKTIEKIVALEKSIGDNSQKLKTLSSLTADEKSGLTKIPYFYQAQIIESPVKLKKVFHIPLIEKRVVIGLLTSMLLILIIALYNLAFNPVISSIEDLEKFSNLPVIGAIYEAKKTVSFD